MGEAFPIHWLIILLVVVLLFGGRKIPEVMRGLGEGIRSFKEGMRGGDHSGPTNPPAPPASTTTTPVAPTEEKK
ncbi:MAG: twin-arginine translocase TatA/TatE family subunit [Candidatus Acidiferrales bacterium]